MTWDLIGRIEKLEQRAKNAMRRVTVPVCDDTNPWQQHQTVGFQNETRDKQMRQQQFGHSAVPPKNAIGVVSYTHGDLNQGTIQSIDDPRYRPKGLKPGENQLYMVDGSSNMDGTGGTTRTVLQGLLGWITNLFGKQIFIGDKDNDTITIGNSDGTTTITLKGKNLIVRIEGDLKVTGEIQAHTDASPIHLTTHLHSGVQPGSGNTAQPVPNS